MNKLIALGEKLLQLMHISIYVTHSSTQPLVLAESQHTYIMLNAMLFSLTSSGCWILLCVLQNWCTFS